MNVDRTVIRAIVAVGAIGASLFSMRAQATPAAHATTALRLAPPRSVWDSVYTEEQAKRGEAVYRQECASCHLETLLGKDDAAPLTGDAFLKGWDGRSVFDLVDQIRTTMPPDSIGKVDLPQTVDVVAYLLRFNGYPAGRTELERDPQPLKDTRIEARKP